MPITENAIAKVEAIVLEAGEIGHLSSEQVEVLRAFFRELEKDVLDAYAADRRVASRMYSREEIAQFWRRQTTWFAAQLQIVQSFERQLRKLPTLHPDLETIEQSVRAAHDASFGHYQAHA